MVAVSVFLPWQSTGEVSTAGSGVVEGQVALIVGLVTVGLIQIGWRPAWIGAGFVVAITLRRILDAETDPAFGLWIAAAASIAAAVLLVWDMFVNVSTAGDDHDKPDGRGLSGPLGRRRR